ncbi:FxDxF family PEP-CTERM protein [Microvirga sp. SRT01]|jgi:hypothetical protein|uniref:FxDxF family PEP-CTERM protein n=1 Tax=Sphingomonas longa TaxID=2778730 RepID=A0ABS2D493_9SPHN|nr:MULTISPECIES: FxDxF family PEP-CTERM protein [Alphaproteobacteria]MBM6575736.1 FxDxF family PEP-CTERM protein [Sphingomonas sp. BT552]MBR7708783.1 FxDxF family PEP-CTERM protein [Microvirga sp. SRT01]
MKTTTWLAAVAATSLMATPAFAADFFLTVGPGTSSTDFGNTGTGSGTIFDRYIFTVPDGLANGLIGSIALNAGLDVDLTSVFLDDKAFDVILTDGTELQTLSWTDLTAGEHVITVNGTWGTAGGSYAGTLNFEPTAVPEPASWALMIAGVGIAGGTLRRRRAVRTTVRFA